MTNEEYATAFCAIDSGTGATDATTWGQMKEALNTVQNDLNSLNPPEDFREFHNAKVAGVEVVAKFADKQPKDDAHNPFLFIGDPATMAIIGAIEVAEQDLSASAWLEYPKYDFSDRGVATGFASHPFSYKRC